jgi:hypothetical protein
MDSGKGSLKISAAPTIIRPHRRQWLIGRADSIEGIPEHFQVRSLCEGLFLHHDPELRIDDTVPAILTLGLLVGDAFNTRAELRHHHSGRFVTIEHSTLYLDATGSMAVFYAQDPGTVICSSSIALIVQVTGAPTLSRELQWIGKSMNWDPSPSCRALGFMRLFSDQALDLKSGRPQHVPRPLLPVTGDPGSLLAEYLVRYMDALKSLSGPIYLPLTAGYDSRTLLAAAISQRLDFTAYTDLRGRRSVIDAHIARRLARRYRFRHVFNWPGEKDEAGLRAYSLHTAGSEGDSGTIKILNRLYDMIPQGAITLSGGVFEVGRVFYRRRLGSIEFEKPREAAHAIAAEFLTDDSSVIEALEQWIYYRQKHTVAGMSMIELFYLDQRLGAWASANRQSSDSVGLNALTPMNSWEAISILLSVPSEERMRTTVQTDAMEILVPAITSAERINPRFPYDLAGQASFWVRAALRRPLSR